ncbi:hypothetical protein BGP_1742 [Beggiatoa sp. PS]|nr:hypothetical protein BGP_1742 [Beggiatoa sp. PS]
MINSTILLFKFGRKIPLTPIIPLEGWRQGKLEFKVKKSLCLSFFKGEFNPIEIFGSERRVYKRSVIHQKTYNLSNQGVRVLDFLNGITVKNIKPVKQNQLL